MKDNYFNIKYYKKILFFYQVNVVIKQFILLKNINDNIYNLLLEFLKRYQHFLKEYINASFNEDNTFFKNIRNFFLEFLLNPLFYQKTSQLNLLKNLENFLDIIVEIIKDKIVDEEILSENIFGKLLGFSYIFNKEDEEQFNQKNQVQNIFSFQRIKSKYSYILINYLECFFSEINNKSDLINIFCNKLVNYKDQPKIFYNLSLVLFISKLIPGLSDNFIKKITVIFQENYIYILMLII